MKRILLISSVVIMLAIGALITVAMLTPDAVYKERIETAAATALGREVALDGDVSLGFFPRITASVEDVSIANPEGFSADHLVRAGALSASVKWGPLFTGKVEVQEIAFIDADVQLQRLADGRTNWEFGTADTVEETPTDEPAPADRQINAGVERARLQNAALTFIDDTAAQTYRFTDLNFEGSVASLAEPLSLTGSGVFEDDAFQLGLDVTAPQALLDGQPSDVGFTFETDIADMRYNGRVTLGEIPTLAGNFTLAAPDLATFAQNLEIDPASLPIDLAPLGGLEARGALSGALETMAIELETLTLKGDAVDFSYVGDITLGQSPSLNGQVDVSSQDLRTLLAAADVVLAPGETLRTFSVSGNTSGTLERLAINNLNMALDDITGSGSLTLRTDTPRPTLIGALQTGPLDLTPFMGAPDEDQPKGWSKEPLALEGLKAIDADITLKSPQIVIDKVTLRDADLAIALNNGLLNATVTEFTAFGGMWNGRLGVNARNATPTMDMAFAGNSILMQDLMKTFTGTDRLSGGGQFAFNATGQGASLDALVNSLDGQLTADLSNGVLKGINVGQLVRTATDLRASLAAGSFDLGLSPGQETDFTNFNSVLEIQDGVAQIQVLEMISSAFGATGSGQIDLGGQTLDMALNIAADKSGQGELVDVQVNNVGIPLRITGDWLSPRIAPDTRLLQRLLAGQAIDRVGNLIGGDAGNVLTGVLGGNRNNEEGGSLEDAARDQLGSAIGSVLQGRGNPADPATEESSDAASPEEEAAESTEAETEEEEEQSLEEELASEVLGSIFGSRKD